MYDSFLLAKSKDNNTKEGTDNRRKLYERDERKLDHTKKNVEGKRTQLQYKDLYEPNTRTPVIDPTVFEVPGNKRPKLTS